MKLHTLESYPILHRFLAHLYEACEIYITDDMFAFIKDDVVSDYCRCSDKECSTLYLRSDRHPILEDDEDAYIETYDSDKGLIIMHFYPNGNIEIEALEYEDYPFKEELIKTYNSDDAKTVVDAYFSSEEQKIETIVID